MKKPLLNRILFTILILINLFSFSQESGKIPVEILQAERLKAGKTKNHQKLTGNVGLKYGSTKLYCDSAEINQINNDFEAWGKILINEKDSIKAWGDYLYFDGKTEVGKLVGNTKLISDNLTLTTDALFFDKKQKVSYYLTGGDIRMENTTIVSKKGYYYSNGKYMTLKDSVVIKNPEYTIIADTLQYFTKSKKSVFLGPTNIELGEESIYCEKGFYNSQDSIAQFQQNASIQQKETTLKADSIFFSNKTGISDCFYNVSLIDTINKIEIKGERGHFERKKDISYITDKTLFIQRMEKDTMYLHADTLRATKDSAGNKAFFAYRGVKLIKTDLQGVCDSLSYSFVDSVINMYYDPIIWNGDNQLTGDSISILTYNNKLHKLLINKNSFIISKVDSIVKKYNQIKGRNMIGYFKEGKLDKMDVIGNGQTIYYAQEDDGSFTGVNKAECSDLTILFKKDGIHKIYFLEQPIATFYPLKEFPSSEEKFKGFHWYGNRKPNTLEDLFK